MIVALGLFSQLLAASEAAPPTRVSVGAYVHNIQDLDRSKHSYAADVYIWFRWKDPKINPAEEFEFMNPSELWGHSKSVAYQKPVRLPDGTLYQTIRTQGRFNKKLDLADFPFDRHILTIEFENTQFESNQLIFVPDASPITINSDLNLPGYKIGHPTFEITNFAYPTRFGDPRPSSIENSYSHIAIGIPISRPPLAYAIKYLIPILCVVFCAALMFLFNPTYVDARVGIGITALLTIVALQITLNSTLPEIDYLVLMDKIYLAAYMYVIGGLAVVVKTTWMIEKSASSLKRVATINRMSLVGLTLIFASWITILLAW